MRTIVRLETVVAALLTAGSACAWEGPKLTRDTAAQPIARTWADVKASVAASIAKTGEGYFAYSRKFNDLGPIDTAGTLTDEELHTQFAMACILASPITVKGPAVKPQLEKWLGDKMLMNVNNDKVARQGHVVAEREGAFVIQKFLWGMNDANSAVAFYNPTDAAKRIAVTARELALNGLVKWTDRFDSSVQGEFRHELAFDVPAHGARLVYVNGKPGMRCAYRKECAVAEKGGRIVWRDVFAPKGGGYSLLIAAGTEAPYRVKVNGLDLGEFRGARNLTVRLEPAENVIDLTGPGAPGVSVLYVSRIDSMLDAVTTAYRLARLGKDYESNVIYSKAFEIPIGELESSGPDEDRALEWIHDALWMWQYDWLWARCAEANGDKARAVKLIETGCFRFRDQYGIEPDDPAFWAHYERLTGKKREPVKKTSGGGDAFDVGKEQKEKSAPTSVEWENAHDDDLAAAVENAELDKVIATVSTADALLSEVKGAYETDPLLATKIAAVTAHVMEGGQGGARRVWADALLKAATESEDDYRRMFFLEQLRWCGFSSQVPELKKLGDKSSKGVKDFVALVVRELAL